MEKFFVRFERDDECVVFIYKSDNKLKEECLVDIIKNILNVNEKQALNYADLLEKEGRCPIKIGTKNQCAIYSNLVIEINFVNNCLN